MSVKVKALAVTISGELQFQEIEIQFQETTLTLCGKDAEILMDTLNGKKYRSISFENQIPFEIERERHTFFKAQKE